MTLVRCIRCRDVQPQSTTRRHPNAYVWKHNKVTVCVSCGYEYAELVR
jgi:hypothetical protein